MLVDLMRNDLGAISRPCSVHVQRYDVEAYATVQHLVSHVGATLTVDPPTAFASVFPGWFHHRLSQNGGLRRHRRH
ncbi:MAG: hypothetical protein CM15mP18_2440 [Methanobacteriota archaeon]|nr:MAG: hypothetical protein CM15mP18_2440 [Euryarchaeota archaeon]